MSKLATLILAFALLGVATAATAQTAVVEDPAAMPDRMTCQVFPSEYNRPPSTRCIGSINDSSVPDAWAEFSVSNFDQGSVAQWSDPSCSQNWHMCGVRIEANNSMTMRATVWYHLGNGIFRGPVYLSATARFANQ